MYDINKAEKYLMNKNKKLKGLIDKNKKEIIVKSKKYKNYPLYINFLKELYRYNSFFWHGDSRRNIYKNIYYKMGR